MFVDSLDLPRTGVIEADVCIVGGGAAGIPVALGLLDSSLRVVLVEGGGLEAGDARRAAFRVIPGSGARSTLGTDPSTHWYFGGNTNNWAGNCRPLDEPDMEARDWVPNSGWPIQRDELLPYYRRSQPVLGLGDFRWYDPGQCRAHLAHPPLGLDPSAVNTRMMQICPVLSLAALHRKRLADEGILQILLRAEAVRLEVDDSGDRVSAVDVICADGRHARIEADTVVLASGGVENARLLLASNDVKSEGLGNDYDLVGRFFTEHWWLDIPLGDWGSNLDLALYDFDSHKPQVIDGAAVWAQLSLAGELMRRERIPGLTFWFAPRPPASASVVAARMLALSALGRVPFDPLTDLRLLLTDAHEAPKHVLTRLTDRGAGRAKGYSLRVQIEQAPDPENRVRLSSVRDAFGRPEPELVLRLAHEERQGHERGLEIAAAELGLNVGRTVKQMRLMFEGRRYGFFWHHMGTTRMDDDPRRGVVDTDCRVHGVSNLFIAGSSVFPTGGTAPPTLTIVALALRLADHLSSTSSPSRPLRAGDARLGGAGESEAARGTSASGP